MTYSYRPRGVCSRSLTFEIDDDNTLHNVEFIGGCNGNLKGIAYLVEGMDVQEVIDKLGGINCGYKNTSCPDQLAEAIRACLNAEAEPQQ